MKIYCDLDGVLVDFVAGLSAIVDGPLPAREDKEAVYKPILETKDFWINLPMMPDAQALIEVLHEARAMQQEVYILTSPSAFDSERAKEQKLAWVREYVGDFKVLFRRGKDKKEYATPNSILIDDLPKNVDLWSKADGVGILHDSADATIAEVRSLVPQLKVSEWL